MNIVFSVVLAAIYLVGATSLHAEEAPVMMPLEEIQPGMEGHWRTVVAGTEIREFPLAVIGVAENFAGPGKSIIICRATDAENILSGPVSGMSGSPVYIDGKLVGAYAYGFMWAKEQAILGVTPIADMLEVLERFDDGDRSAGVAAGFREPSPPATVAPDEASVASRGGMPSRETLQTHLRPLPMSLSISGISSGVLEAFADRFRALGVEPTLVPMGRTSSAIDTDLQPGSAVAGVLLDGDFNIAGTGTVTYRDGDRILAFGHPFLGMGATDLPMAAAEVMTVIRAFPGAFKLSNTGPVVGAIYQDRLSGIAGEIGRQAPVTRLTLNVEDQNGSKQTYSGNLFKHPQMSPLVSSVALAESLTLTMEASLQQTFFLRAEWDIDGFDPIVVEDVSSGPNSPTRLAVEHLALYTRLASNSFAEPTVNAITYDISVLDEWLISQLESAFIDRRRVKGGETVLLDLVVRGYRGERRPVQVEVPIPGDLSSQTLTLFVGDAASARRYDPATVATPTSLGQILENARGHLGRQAIYVRLMKQSAGVSVEGRSMPNLLPSVAASLRSPHSRTPSGNIAYSTVWESSLPIEGEFRGQTQFQLEIE